MEKKEYWVVGAIESFSIARSVRDSLSLKVIVAAAFSLRSGHQQIGINFNTPSEFFAQLDWSPPSLYLFPADEQPWEQKSSVLISASMMFENPVEAQGCYFIEFQQQESTEYSRSVVVIG